MTRNQIIQKVKTILKLITDNGSIEDVMNIIKPIHGENILLVKIDQDNTLITKMTYLANDETDPDEDHCIKSSDFEVKALNTFYWIDLIANLKTILNYILMNFNYIAEKRTDFVLETSEYIKTQPETGCRYPPYHSFKILMLDAYDHLTHSDHKLADIKVDVPTQTVTNDVIELIDIMTPFIDMMYDSIFVHKFIEKSQKRFKQPWNLAKCDASKYKDISLPIARFLRSVYFYEYFEHLSKEIKNGLTKKQTKTFAKINRLNTAYANKSNGSKKTTPLEMLTNLVNYKLDSTQCEKTNAFVNTLKTKASQSVLLTKENLSNKYTDQSNIINRESDITTTQSITDSSLLSDEDEINRITIKKDAVNRISDTEPIIKYIDSITSSIIPFDEDVFQGGKLKTRRNRTTKNRKQTLRKRK